MQQAEELLRRVGTPKQQARALSNMAVALNGLRRRSEAEPVFEEASIDAQQRAGTVATVLAARVGPNPQDVRDRRSQLQAPP